MQDASFINEYINHIVRVCIHKIDDMSDDFLSLRQMTKQQNMHDM